jgi:hypothetical protein
MTELVRINTGKAVHEASVWTSENGKKHYSVGCGASKHNTKEVIRKAGKGEQVTCKKCLARMEQEQKVEEKEMSLKEYVAQHGKTFIIEKKHVETAEEKELKAFIAQNGRSFKLAK